MKRKVLSLGLVVLSVLSACESTPRPRSASSSETVPTNSAFEGKGAARPAEEPKPAEPKAEEPSGSGSVPSPAAGSGGSGGPVPSGGSNTTSTATLRGPEPTRAPATGAVSQAECASLFDRYIDLEMGDNAKLAGIPPEIIQQAKQQARAQSGDPCVKEKVPRAKYNCAMAARTTAAWRTCMK